MSVGFPRPAIGHMPFKGHRTCAEWGPEYEVRHFLEALGRHGNVARAARGVGQTVNWGEQQLITLARDLEAPR